MNRGYPVRSHPFSIRFLRFHASHVDMEWKTGNRVEYNKIKAKLQMIWIQKCWQFFSFPLSIGKWYWNRCKKHWLDVFGGLFMFIFVCSPFFANGKDCSAHVMPLVFFCSGIASCVGWKGGKNSFSSNFLSCRKISVNGFSTSLWHSTCVYGTFCILYKEIVSSYCTCRYIYWTRTVTVNCYFIPSDRHTQPI